MTTTPTSNPMQDAYMQILRSYNPLEIKDILLHGAARKATKHRDADDITTYYANYNEGIHHNLLDAKPKYCQEVLDANFDGYTIQDATGTWKSDLEDTKIVIINTTNQDKVEDVAWHYKDMFDQEAVGHYVTSPMEFI